MHPPTLPHIPPLKCSTPHPPHRHAVIYISVINCQPARHSFSRKIILPIIICARLRPLQAFACHFSSSNRPLALFSFKIPIISSLIIVPAHPTCSHLLFSSSQ